MRSQRHVVATTHKVPTTSLRRTRGLGGYSPGTSAHAGLSRIEKPVVARLLRSIPSRGDCRQRSRRASARPAPPMFRSQPWALAPAACFWLVCSWVSCCEPAETGVRLLIAQATAANARTARQPVPPKAARHPVGRGPKVREPGRPTRDFASPRKNLLQLFVLRRLCLCLNVTDIPGLPPSGLPNAPRICAVLIFTRHVPVAATTGHDGHGRRLGGQPQRKLPSRGLRKCRAWNVLANDLAKVWPGSFGGSSKGVGAG